MLVRLYGIRSAELFHQPGLANTLLDDRGLALATINSLKNQGIRIAIDDFGTGYASLSQPRKLPFDRIKIDKSFVSALLDDHQCQAIVHAIATLGTSLELPITAEGVESKAIYNRLRELGCADMQGWLFGKAVPQAEAQQMLQDQLTSRKPMFSPGEPVAAQVMDPTLIVNRARLA